MIGINRPMPKDCDECPCNHDNICYADECPDRTRYRYDGRPEDCPLIEAKNDSKKVIEWFKKRRDGSPMAGAKEMFGHAMAALERQEQDKWIPVTENPKKPASQFDTYLVYTKYERFGVADFFADGSWIGYDIDGDQIDEGEISAWRQLPEPYKEDKT